MYDERRSIDGRLARLCNVVAAGHPSGYEAISARYRIERQAAGQDVPALQAMEARWLELEAEAQAEIARRAQAEYDRNFANQLAEMRRGLTNQWREKQPLHGIIRTLRQALDEAGYMVGVEDDAGLLDHFDRFGAALKAADMALGVERREAKIRVANARAAATVETFAPLVADVA